MTKIRFATIGTSKITRSFLNGARHDERFELSAVYSRSEETAKAFAAEYGAPKIYTSLEALAADKDIDAVYIASPNFHHVSQSVMMMDAGKHVLCEKPYATDPEEALLPIEAAKRNNVAFMEAMKTTLLPNFEAVKENLPRLGKIRRFFAQFCQYSSRYDDYKAGGEHIANVFNPDMRGGAILDLGVYGIAPLIHLFGVPWEGEFTPEKLNKCVSVTSTLTLPGGCTDPSKAIDGGGTLVVHYPDMEAVITYSKISDSSLASEIQGEDGCIIIDKLSNVVNPQIQFREGSGTRGDSGFVKGGGEKFKQLEKISRDTIDDNMYYEVKEFIDIICDGRIESKENTFERSLQTIQICSARKLN